jgi:hypothetical protein
MQLLKILTLLYGSGIIFLSILSLGDFLYMEDKWKEKIDLLIKRIYVLLLWPVSVFSRDGRHVLIKILKGDL